MSLHPEDPTSPPEETRRVARAAFPKGTLCLDIADALGAIYQDSQFAALFAQVGQPAAAPAMLALATVLQYMEGLSDRQAADAVRARIDWKYALRLELTDAGFDHTVLSEFRSRLVEGKAELLLLDTLLGSLPRTRSAAEAGPATDGFHPRASRCPGAEPFGASRRDAAGRAECFGRGRAHLAAGPGSRRVVSALWRAGGELRPTQNGKGPSGVGDCDGGRWAETAGGSRCRDGTELVARSTGGED